MRFRIRSNYSNMNQLDREILIPYKDIREMDVEQLALLLEPLLFFSDNLESIILSVEIDSDDIENHIAELENRDQDPVDDILLEYEIMDINEVVMREMNIEVGAMTDEVINGEEVKNEEVKNEEVKNEEVKNEDVKNEDVKNEDTKVEDIRDTASKDEDKKVTEMKIEEMKDGGAGSSAIEEPKQFQGKAKRNRGAAMKRRLASCHPMQLRSAVRNKSAPLGCPECPTKYSRIN